MRAVKHIGSYLIVLLVVAVIGFLYTQTVKPTKIDKVTVTIEKGLTAGEIADVLSQHDVIDSRFFFMLTAYLEGVESKFLSGRYEMTTHMDNGEVIDLLMKGPPDTTFTLTIPEGYTAEQIAVRVGNISDIDRDEFLDYAEFQAKSFNFEFLSSNTSDSLEGYLFPKTYEVENDTDAYGLINRLLEQFEKETASIDLSYAKKNNMTLHQVITVASLVEEEAKIESEKPLMASVIYNRLRIGMPLQIDATVQYALPERKEVLTLDDLKIDSPYNTYKNKGLPPGPIANPSVSSIKAALAPANNKYLYYVLSDLEGHHTFTNTYEEFLKAKKKSKDFFQR